MEKVRDASSPRTTGLALYLQDAEHNVMCEVAKEATANGARIMSYVFDGIYILAVNNEHLRATYQLTATAIYQQFGLKLALKDAAGDVLEKIDFQADANSRKRAFDAGGAGPSKLQRA